MNAIARSTLIGVTLLLLAEMAIAADKNSKQDLVEWVAKESYAESGDFEVRNYVSAGFDRMTAEKLARKFYLGASRCLVDTVLREIEAAGGSRQQFLSEVLAFIDEGGTIDEFIEKLPVPKTEWQQRATPCILAVAQESGIAF